MPVVSASNFTPATQSLFPFTGTVKLGGDYEQSGGTPCSGCAPRPASTLFVYVDGALVDLWGCNGCKCVQLDISSQVNIVENALYPISVHPGALLPEDSCGCCEYQKEFFTGLSAPSSLEEIWRGGVALGFTRSALAKAVVDASALQVRTEELENQIAARDLVIRTMEFEATAMRTEIAELRLKVAYQPGSATSSASECDTKELIDRILQAV